MTWHVDWRHFDLCHIDWTHTGLTHTDWMCMGQYLDYICEVTYYLVNIYYLLIECPGMLTGATLTCATLTGHALAGPTLTGCIMVWC
jgi:hypothetical protein